LKTAVGASQQFDAPAATNIYLSPRLAASSSGSNQSKRPRAQTSREALKGFKPVIAFAAGRAPHQWRQQMSTKYEDANLILKLYELRREEVMRKARDWYVQQFNPGSLQEISDIMMSDKSAYYRMVTTYWDMAASFVNHGAIDEQMFSDANMEHVVVFAKIEPFLAEIRSTFIMPNYLVNLEKLVMNRPNAKEFLSSLRERFKQFAAMRAEAASKAQAG
jgi:hypothetical protein